VGWGLFARASRAQKALFALVSAALVVGPSVAIAPSSAALSANFFDYSNHNVATSTAGLLDWANNGALTSPSATGSTWTRAGSQGVFDGGVYNGGSQPPTPPALTPAATSLLASGTIGSAAFMADPLSSDSWTCQGNSGPVSVSGDPTTFTGAGSEKNNGQIGTFTYGTSGNTPAKDEISNVYAISHNSASTHEVFFGGERVVNNGDSHIDFEFLQAPLAISNPCGAGTMSGHRTQRDLLLSTDFSNGGTLSSATLYSWSCNNKAPGQSGYDASKDFTICDPPANGSPGSTDPQYVAVTMSGVASFGVNASDITCGGWVCRNSSGTGTNTLLANTFMEGGIDLAAAGFTGCFNTFLPHTRSAQQFTATLKDFAGPISFSNCKTPTVTTTQSAGGSTGANITAVVPASVTDTATLHGAASSVKGSVTYKLFSDSKCTTEVGSPSTKTINGTTDASGNLVLPASDPVSVTTAGTYYWTASYSGDTSQGGQNNQATSACGDEVLTVVAPALSITKTADAATVSAGDNIGFTITVTNNGQGAANNTAISDALPSGSGVSWSISPAYAGPGTCSITGTTSQTLSCAVGTLAAGASASVHVTSATSRASCGLYPNSATVSASNNGTVPPAIASTTVQCPTLSITKTADSSAVSAGTNIGFTITVSNSNAAGTGTAKSVTLSDPLPTGTGIAWSISPPYAGPGSCSITSGTLNCSFGDVAPGASVSVHVTSPTVFASCATYPNTASAQATNNPKVTADATTSVQCPGLHISKTADDASVSAGDPIGFTVTVSNSGPGTATGVTLSDPLPAGSGVSWSISPAYSGPGTCAITSGTLNCMFGDMASGASISVHVTSATSNASCGVYPNTATAKATNDGQQQASASTTVNCPSLSILKTADHGTVSAGDAIGFTITLNNAGPGVAKSATLSDPLPTGAGISWSISPAYAGPGTCSIASNTLSCSFGDMAAGASASVHITSSTTIDTPCATYSNTASAQATNNPKVQSTASTQVLCPSLQIAKTADATQVSAGDAIGFTITVTNTGAGTATAATLTDLLPGGSGVSWSVSPAYAGPGTCSIAGSAPNQSLNCSFGDLASGASAVVHVSSATARASCGTYPNTATAAATNNASVQASASITVNCPNLAITKTADDSAVSAGSDIGFTIHVSNPGPGVAKSATLSDPLPTGTDISWSISPAYAGPGTCSITSNTLSCSFGDMAAGASATVHITSPTTASTPCADYKNTASARATNNPVVQATATTTVQCPGLQITKTADDTSVSAGDPIGFTITVSNTGAGTATAATLSDPLPAGAGISWSISPAYAGPGSCAIASGKLQCSFGDLASGASASVHVSSATSFASCATYPNDATASASNTGSVHATASTTVDCPALTIHKDADAASVNAGENIGFTITVGNSGAGTAKSVTLSDPLPTGNGISWSISPAYAGPGTCSIASNTLSCSFGDMVSGASISVHVSSATSAQSCATYENTASAQASNHAKVQASASTTVKCSNLAITKTADAPTVSAGDPIGFTITVSNSGVAGTGTAKAVTLKDPLPTGTDISWSISPAYAGPGTCSIVSNTLSCSFGDMVPGASISVHVSSATTAQSCAKYENTASAQATNNAKVQASASTTVECPALAITKTADASPVNTGDPIGFSITVSNSGVAGTGTAKAVTLKDPLPGGSGVDWSIAPAYAGPGSCSITGSAPSQTLSCSFGDMAPGASVSVHIASATTAASAGTYPNTATASASNTDSVHDSATIEVLAPQLTISKAADDATVSAGDSIGFTVIVGNSGPGVARSVTLDDPLPGGTDVSWSISPAYGGQGTCDVTGSTPTQKLSCSFGDMVVGASASVHVTSATSAQSCADYPNAAKASTTNGTDVHASASTTVDCPGLHITKTADDTSVSAGDAIGFSISVSNTGLGTAKSVTLDDPLPGGSGVDWSISPDYAGPGTCSITGSAPVQTLDCSLGDLGPSGSASVHVTSPTEFASCAAYPNQASAVATNNAKVQASASTTVDCPALAITKTADASPVNTGDDIGFTVTVSNTGPGTAKSVTLDDPLPAGMGIDWSITPAYAGPGSCSISGSPQTLDCAFGDLAANGSASVHIVSHTTADSAGTYNNTATAKADNAPKVDASASVVVDPPAIAITKTADAPQVDAGHPIGFTVTVSNGDVEGTGTARAVTLSDLLPGGGDVSWSVSPAYSGPGTCSVAGTAPDQTLTCAFGDMAPGASASVHITSTTTDASVGDYPNTATASATNASSVQASADTKVIAVVPITVAGSTTTTTPAPTTTAAKPTTLPFTGSNGSGLATVGFVLLVAGGFLALSWRRRRTARS
jgi:uncharacterized repeat protein (TIGR01451 family)